MRSHEYDGMSDDQLYALSKRTMLTAHGLPKGSAARAAKWVAYDEMVKELGRRMENIVARELGLPEEP